MGEHIFSVDESTKPAVGVTHGVEQEIVAVQPASLVVLSEINLKEIQPLVLVDVIEKAPILPQNLSL